MNIRRFRALHAAGAIYAEIARECGCDGRTVRKYLVEDAPSAPPSAPARVGTQPRLIDPFVEVIEAWLRADITLKGAVVHERLVAEHGFTGHYQRVKMFLAEARLRIAAELAATDETRSPVSPPAWTCPRECDSVMWNEYTFAMPTWANRSPSSPQSTWAWVPGNDL